MSTYRFPALLCLLAVACAPVVTACGDDGTTRPPRTWIPDPGRPPLDATYTPSGRAAAGDVFVHLFEWSWADIAAECEAHLGPTGYSAVQVSPPQEHIVLNTRPWWERYQPVSYSLAQSRSGTRAEFTDMVARCDAVGVGIYVDAVINHMTAGSGVGTAGTSYTKYHYPGLYDADDFHPRCTVNDYQDAANVQDCELLGLADLDTGKESVRGTIAGYLLDLVRLGVAGFRIDAAKHMQPVELDSILDLVNRTAAAEGYPLPFWFAEVIDHGGEAVSASDYYGLAYGSGGVADITEFRFRAAGERFLGGGPSVADLADFRPGAWGLMPADKAVIFLQNHDTQRHGGLGYRHGALYRLAHVWMLAQPYGHPKVMSSYAFDIGSQLGRDAGPPDAGPHTGGSDGAGGCARSIEEAERGEWVCEHRDPVIAAMVRFRRVVAGSRVEALWDDGDHGLAFSRGARGLVALNAGPDTLEATIPTTVPAGEYCDILTGGCSTGGGCAGRTVVVEEGGVVRLELGPTAAIAIHLDAIP